MLAFAVTVRSCFAVLSPRPDGRRHVLMEPIIGRFGSKRVQVASEKSCKSCYAILDVARNKSGGPARQPLGGPARSCLARDSAPISSIAATWTAFSNARLAAGVETEYRDGLGNLRTVEPDVLARGPRGAGRRAAARRGASCRDHRDPWQCRSGTASGRRRGARRCAGKSSSDGKIAEGEAISPQLNAARTGMASSGFTCHERAPRG